MDGLEPIHEAQERDRKDPFLQRSVPLESNPGHLRTNDSPAKELTAGRSVRKRARARSRSAQNPENPPFEARALKQPLGSTVALQRSAAGFALEIAASLIMSPQTESRRARAGTASKVGVVNVPAWLPRDYELCRASPGLTPRPLRVGGAWRGAPPAERPSPGSRAVSASPRRAARASLTYAGADEPPLSTLAPEAAPLSLASAAPVPDGRRSLASEAKRLDNARRAHESGLAAPQRGFFQQGILRDGAPQREHDVALSLLRSAEERAARANHGSKDKRLGTSLSKYELLLRALPAMRPFEPLRFEGDLQTSERNEVLLVAIAEFIRRNPKATGGLVRADSVSGQVSGVKAIVEEHLGRKVLAPSGGRVLARELQQMRLEDGPSADRALSLPLRSDHLDRLADESSGFDRHDIKAWG